MAWYLVKHRVNFTFTLSFGTHLKVVQFPGKFVRLATLGIGRVFTPAVMVTSWPS